ncbi:poly(ADP-ribose) glycohydrolase-like isoform X2 [Cloeon dipterum]|uniref:poly(ADP-ribose) glycohydrolase-like isoform X2 n=1 Tax=Cloeon dipterum TaxID=197152 RepID=UPI00321FA0AD
MDLTVKHVRKRMGQYQESLSGIFNNNEAASSSHSSSSPSVGASQSGQHKRFVAMPYPTNHDGSYNREAKCSAEVKAKFDQLNSFSGKEHTAQLELIVKKHTPEYDKFNFDVLRVALGQLQSDYRTEYFNSIFPGIVSMAKKLPDKFGNRPLVFLTAGRCLELKRKEIACLLANAYLCTFPNRDSRASKLPTVNFITLFSGQLGRDKRESAKVEKLKCLFAYFHKAKEFEKSPEGEEIVSFTKVASDVRPDWKNSRKTMKNFFVEALDKKIEDSIGIQVDFANKLIGGGVIGRGCLQEEIRFITCPELIVARLFTEQLKDNEALVITNFWQYADHSGYQDDFKCLRPFSGSNNVKRTLVAIDATDFSNSSGSKTGGWQSEDNTSRQYSKPAIDRELNKAYAGFLCQELSPNFHIATGNWGGGSFKGDPLLKAMIQHVAASEAERDLYYFPYHDYSLKKMLESSVLATRGKSTVGEAYRELLSYAKEKSFRSKH